MKYLGIDYGEKRVGIAISDEKAVFAFPYSILSNSVRLSDEVADICIKEGIGEIILGESRNYQGQPNTIMNKVNEFAEGLRMKTLLKVKFEPEFMTSIQATRDQGENKLLDASAAALILQSFLDMKKNRAERAEQAETGQDTLT